MIKASFTIATTHGIESVVGFKTDDTSLIGVHRDNTTAPWTVTFLPTGTKIDTVFPERFQSRDKLLRRITYLEAIELPAWLSLSDLPFGALGFRETDADAVARIRAAAQA